MIDTLFETFSAQLTRPHAAATPWNNSVALPYENLPVFDPCAWQASAIRDDFPDLVKAYERAPRCDEDTGKPLSFDAWWTDTSNCYLYALDDRTALLNRLRDSTNLGALSGATPSWRPTMTAQRTFALMQADGFIATGGTVEWQEGTRPVALFIAKKQDFHFLRLDRLAPDSDDVVWTHKGREYLPSILSTPQGTPILDPRPLCINASHFGPYHFAGFFNIPLAPSFAPTPFERELARIGALALTEEEKRRVHNPRITLSAPQLG